MVDNHGHEIVKMDNLDSLKPDHFVREGSCDKEYQYKDSNDRKCKGCSLIRFKQALTVKGEHCVNSIQRNIDGEGIRH